LGAGVRVEDVRAASEYLEREVAVVQSERTGALRALRGDPEGIPAGLRRPDEFHLVHTHPTYSTDTSIHLSEDIAKASSRVEAVIDWGGNVTHFNRTGVLTTPPSSPINRLGYIVGY